VIGELSRREWIAGSLAAPVAVQAAAPPKTPRVWNGAVLLGRSDLRVTPLGMGCEEVRDVHLIERACEFGIGYFNCFIPQNSAGNLALFGDAIRPYRKSVVISAGSNAKTRDSILKSFDDQAALLKTDTIDLWYLTSRQTEEHLSPEVLETLRTLRQQGRCRAIGITTHAFAQISDHLVRSADVIDAAMITGNFAVWSKGDTYVNGYPETGFATNVRKLRAAGIGIVGMKPLVGGSLKTVEERAAALRWVLENPMIDTAPVCVRSIKELEENVRASAQIAGIKDERILRSGLLGISSEYCRMCRSCDGTCRRNLPIADLMRFLTYAEGYGDPARGRASFQQLPQSMQAVRCQDCSTCTVVCPNGVRVQDQIAHAQQVLA